MRIAVFASGAGSNAENLIRYFSANGDIIITSILTNNPKAGVIDRCKNLNIPCHIFSKAQFIDGNDILKFLEEQGVDAIILAGFLLLIPENIIKNFPDRIINIHPALLPLHGGKGFYGANVHQAVIESKSIISGITIHKVNAKFDEGEIIFQAACHVSPEDTAESLANKIHSLEYKYFPTVAKKYLLALN